MIGYSGYFFRPLEAPNAQARKLNPRPLRCTAFTAATPSQGVRRGRRTHLAATTVLPRVFHQEVRAEPTTPGVS